MSVSVNILFLAPNLLRCLVFADESLLRDVLGEDADKLNLLDKPQLACVIRVCRQSATMSEAGRRLFAVSRQEKRSINKSDRVRKYLSRFCLDWKMVSRVLS